MGMQYDVWAVTPATAADTNFYVESVTPSVAGNLTLANTTPSVWGCGYKVVLKTAADESAVNFTITGIGVNGESITETFAGPSSATTKNSTNYYSSVSNIYVSAGTAGAIELGYSADFAIPRTRIKGVYLTGTASAGSVVITRVRDSYPVLNMASPAAAAAGVSLYMPAEGILVGNQVTDYATVVRTNLASLTLICG